MLTSYNQDNEVIDGKISEIITTRIRNTKYDAKRGYDGDDNLDGEYLQYKPKLGNLSIFL